MAERLFAYGSLMIPSVLRSVTGCSYRHEEAILRGYARYRLRGESYPGLVPLADSETRGVVYHDVDDRSLARLDEFEGDWYRRTAVRVTTLSGVEAEAETYVVAPAHRHRVSDEPWALETFRQRLLKAFLRDYPGFHGRESGDQGKE